MECLPFADVDLKVLIWDTKMIVLIQAEFKIAVLICFFPCPNHNSYYSSRLSFNKWMELLRPVVKESEAEHECVDLCYFLGFVSANKEIFSDGRIIDVNLVKQTIASETEIRLIRAGSVVNRLHEAAELLEKFATESELSDFLTLDAYDRLVMEGN